MKKLYQFITLNRLTILSFLSVGAISAIINFLSFSLFLNFTNMNYETAVSISFMLSVLFHFTANRYFTFQCSGMNLHRQLPKYISMVLGNYILTLIVMHVIVEIAHLSPYIGNITAIATTVGVSFFVSRYWVFS